MAWVRRPLARLVQEGEGYCLGPQATGPPGAEGRRGVLPGYAGLWPAWCWGQHHRYLTPKPPRAGGDRGDGPDTPASGPPGAERLLTTGRIIGLLKYPLELGKIRRGQGWVINNQ